MSPGTQSASYVFPAERFLPPSVFARITDLRLERPDLVREELSRRKRRRVLAPDGRLVLLAADHPARYLTNVGADATAMGDRLQFLARILRVLQGSRVDGLMATADVVDEVVLANVVHRERTGKSLLDDRILVGSMNRMGLSGFQAEMLDRMTAYRTARRVKEMGLDGGKLLLRFAPGDASDRLCLETQEACAVAMEELQDEGLWIFLEPLAVAKGEKSYKTVMDPDALIKAVSAGAALSHCSTRTWIKIPVTRDYGRVVRATTCPILMLGGESTGKPEALLEDFGRGMRAGPNVRGALVGRNVLWPGAEDPAVIAEAISAIVHDGAEAAKALAAAAPRRDQGLGAFGGG